MEETTGVAQPVSLNAGSCGVEMLCFVLVVFVVLAVCVCVKLCLVMVMMVG